MTAHSTLTCADGEVTLPAVPARSSTPGPVATAPADTPDITSASAIELEPSPATTGACTLIWVETEPADLANKNRAMIWEEIVRDRVAGSGMYALLKGKAPRLGF